MKKIKKENLAFFTTTLKKKDTYKTFEVMNMPFDTSLLPTGKNSSGDERKWDYLTDLAVGYLRDEKELPTYAQEQDYERSGSSFYRTFTDIESDAYEIINGKEEDGKEIKTFEVTNTALDKIILPAGFREKIMEVCQQLKESKKIFETWGLGEKIKKGKGVNFLFSGASGTGKTYCGEIIAEYLGTTAEIVSVANLESKWVGESEKNIADIFASLSGNNKVLILDEVDSFLTSRSHVDQMYQNKLTNQFLIELERHNGIVVMTTNRPVRLDKALERRIDLVLDFPLPDSEAREKIWIHHIPDKMPKDGEIDTKKIGSFELNGGQIKNALLSAARKMVSENSKLSTELLVRCILEEQKDAESLINGKDHA